MKKMMIIEVLGKHSGEKGAPARTFLEQFGRTREADGFQQTEVLTENRERTLDALRLVFAKHPDLQKLMKKALEQGDFGLAAYLVLDPKIIEDPDLLQALEVNWDREIVFGIGEKEKGDEDETFSSQEFD